MFRGLNLASSISFFLCCDCHVCCVNIEIVHGEKEISKITKLSSNPSYDLKTQTVYQTSCTIISTSICKISILFICILLKTLNIFLKSFTQITRKRWTYTESTSILNRLSPKNSYQIFSRTCKLLYTISHLFLLPKLGYISLFLLPMNFISGASDDYSSAFEGKEKSARAPDGFY